jgi:hypothetical protein
LCFDKGEIMDKISKMEKELLIPKPGGYPKLKSFQIM